MMNEQHRDKRLKSTSLHDTIVATAPALANDNYPSSASPTITSKPPVKTKAAPPPPTFIAKDSLLDDPVVWENAVVYIDKPQGWTSFDVCGKLRGTLAHLLRRKAMKIKVGHAGTLDPMATGLLIVCVGKATKSIDTFVAMHKEYSGVLRLGEATPSYDADSEVTERQPWEHITNDALENARDTLLGEIEQLPPMFSAIRVNGKRLYEAARQGKDVERKSRKVTVRRFDLKRESESDQNVEFYIECSKGTYVRSLAHDLGEKVGSAAHLTALRREAIGEHKVVDAWDIEELARRLNIRVTEMKEQKSAVEVEEKKD